MVLAFHAATAQTRQQTHIDPPGFLSENKNADTLKKIFISFDGDNLTLKDIIDIIQQYTPFRFFVQSGISLTGHPVRLHSRSLSVWAVLDSALRDQHVRINVENRSISLERGKTVSQSVKVYVVGKEDVPLEGATLTLAPGKAVKTDNNGFATMQMVQGYDSLKVTYTGAQSQTVSISGLDSIVIHMVLESSLTEITVNRLSRKTRSVNKGEIIKDLPGIRIPAAGTMQHLLSGLGTGALSIQKNGIPGSGMSIFIRGRSALVGDTPPLYIVDGMRFISQSMGNIVDGNSGGVGLSPLALLAGAIVTDIHVLKDADSLAQYGAMGVNGVVIISTIRSRDNGHLSFNVNTGAGVPTRNIHLMNSRQYGDMRLEALRNDSITPDATNAPDLVLWDTTKNTDWNKNVFPGLAKVLDASMSASMKWKNFSLLGSAAYRQEEEILGHHPRNYLGTLYGSATYVPCDRMQVCITVIYSNNNNNQYTIDQTTLQYYVPSVPSLDSSQRLLYTVNGVLVNNPLAFNQYKYGAHTQTIVGNFGLTYKPGRWELQLNGGYTGVGAREGTLIPAMAQNPLLNPMDMRYSAHTTVGGRFLEAQLSYGWRWGNWIFLAGGGVNQYIQHNVMDAPADTVSITSASPGSGFTITDYRIAGASLRLSANAGRRLYVDMTVRRDVSSRMVPAHAAFNSVAAGSTWIFFQRPAGSNEKLFFYGGKAHLSYGVAGSDAIPDYSYQPVWSAMQGNIPTQLAGAIYPSAPADSSLTWRRIQKLSVGTTLDLYGGLISIGVVYYHHLCKDQLVPYVLPSTTGFSTELRNRDAVLRNTGWEISLAKLARKNSKLKWMSSLSFTMPQEKLVRFQGLENSYYKNTFMIGQPLEAVKLYQYMGVNNTTGYFSFKDFNGDGKYTDSDRQVIRKPGIRMYGGWTNKLQLGQWQLEATLEFMLQTGYDYLRDIFVLNPPGSLGSDLFSNMSTRLLDRWRKQGDHAAFEKLTTLPDSEAAMRMQLYLNSTGILRDASFLRMKLLTLSYTLPPNWLHKMKLKANAKVYLQAQNLFTLTPYPEVDPMLQSGLVCPLVKSISVGFQMQF